MYLTSEEMDRLESVQTMEQWDDACDAVKNARGGVYPHDWWLRVMRSGLAERVAARWKNAATEL